MSDFTPAYLKAKESGLLDRRAEEARALLEGCAVCPRKCGVNRLAGETGVCKTGENAEVSSYSPHFGEEAPLVGKNGSGTIFFTHCNLMCNFCQNFDISHLGDGAEATPGRLAAVMLALQEQGCHNINFVTPTHVTPQILAALSIAVENGLDVPLVYNCGGYERVETLRLLDGIVDIYMPDFKFQDKEPAEQTCCAPDYPETARAALLEMHRQVGDLTIDKRGIAVRGLLVRHLVMPGGMAGTREAMRFIAQRISKNTYVNVMPQYRPCGRAAETPGLNRMITAGEFETALKLAREEGVTRLDERPHRAFRLW